MKKSQRVPMWLIEQEVGAGLPTERHYDHSGLGPPVGYIIMSRGMTIVKKADYLSFFMVFDSDRLPSHIASLSGWRSIQAAINGEFGLSWELATGSEDLSHEEAAETP